MINLSQPLVPQYRDKYNSEFFVLKDDLHANLCRKMDLKVRKSGTSEKHICFSTRAFPQYAGLIKSFKDLNNSGKKIMFVEMPDPLSRFDLLSVISGYLIRNFLDSRITNVETVTNLSIDYEEEPAVLIIPDVDCIIADNKRTFTSKNIRLSSILSDRHSQGLVTIVGYTTRNNLEQFLSADVLTILEKHGSQI